MDLGKYTTLLIHPLCLHICSLYYDMFFVVLPCLLPYFYHIRMKVSQHKACIKMSRNLETPSLVHQSIPTHRNGQSNDGSLQKEW